MDPTVVAFATIAMAFVAWIGAIVLSFRARLRGERMPPTWLEMVKVIAIAMIQFAMALLVINVRDPVVQALSVGLIVLGLFWIFVGYQRVRARSKS
jgi:hypothetical protein